MRSRLPIIGISLGIALLTLIPYGIAYANAGELRFMGFLFNPADGASYLAKMRQGYEGQWLYHLAFTENPGPGVLLFPWYLFLGHLARIFSLPLIAIWQIARLTAATVFLVTAWEFLGRIGLAARARAVAWVVTALGSGFGFIMIGLHLPFTTDLWVPEYIPFLGLLTNVHFPLSIGLILILLMRIAWPVRKPTIFSFLLTGLIGAMLGALQPFAVLPVGLALAAWIIWRRVASGRFPDGAIAGLIAAGLGMLPWVVYDYWITRTLPDIASWFAQNQTPTPPLWDVALSMGLPGLIVGVSFLRWLLTPKNFREKIRSIPSASILLGLWLAINLILLYAPFSLQRRLMLGMWIPLAALAAPKIEAWLFRPAFSLTRGWIIGVPLVLTNAAFFVLILAGGLRRNPDLFLGHDEAAAVDWLNANAHGAVVLASPEISQWLPGMAGARVVYGHPMETPNAEKMRNTVERFFSGADTGELLNDHNIDFIFYGPREKIYGGNLQDLSSIEIDRFGDVVLLKIHE